MKKNKKTFSFFDVILIVIITSVIMCFLGGILVYKHLGGVNFSALGSDEHLQEFVSAYNTLLDKYYDSLDSNTLIDGAIGGMYSKVDDPYTTYLDENSTNNLNTSLEGEYTGIGIRIGTTDNNVAEIVEVFDDSPAAKVGLQEGDKITSVQNTSTEGMDITDISNLIKANENNKINLSVSRNEIVYTYDVEVTKLNVQVVNSQIIKQNDQNVGYIKLSVFNDTADIQFANALTKLETQNISSLIIDLRSNSGGYLQVAKNIAEMFLEKNKEIYSLRTKDNTTSYKDETSEKRNYKIIILINKGSASASEILAASLKYSYGATLLGVQSYGKGKVQEKASLTTGTTIKYTTAEWLTPNGDCIDGIGLTPDVTVEFDSENYNENDIKTDNQLMNALNNLVS